MPTTIPPPGGPYSSGYDPLQADSKFTLEFLRPMIDPRNEPIACELEAFVERPVLGSDSRKPK